MLQLDEWEKVLTVWFVGWNMDQKMAHSEQIENAGQS